MSRRGEGQKPSDAWKAKNAEVAEKRRKGRLMSQAKKQAEASYPAQIRERDEERTEQFWEREAKRQRRRRDPRARRRAKSAWMQTRPSNP